jgi:hypothetical protein
MKHGCMCWCISGRNDTHFNTPTPKKSVDMPDCDPEKKIDQSYDIIAISILIDQPYLFYIMLYKLQKKTFHNNY